MHRRELLCTCVGCASMLAGCTAGDAPSLDSSDERRHPFADRTVTVRIDNRSETDHDVGTNAREALAYWDEHAQTYAGFDVWFEVVDTDPDLTIAYVDTPDPCRDVEGFSELVLGCAPLITPRHRVPDELTAYVVAAARPFGKIRITTKHEIGHVLGLYHDDDPREIMSNRPEDRIPLYATRIDIWEGVIEAHARSNDGTRLFSLGVDTWTAGQYEAAEAAFRAGNEEFQSAAGLVEAAFERTAEFDGHPRVETVALEDLRAHLGRLEDRIRSAEGFTGRMADASVSMARGDRQRATEQQAQANDHVRAFNEVGPVELRDVAVALGLVRGFDRDEPVVDVDEDELA